MSESRNPRPGCYDENLDFHEHEPIGDSQRFLSPRTGECKKLKVQTVHEPRGMYVGHDAMNILPVTQQNGAYETVKISDSNPPYIAIAVKLYNEIPRKWSMEILSWVLWWFALWLAVTWEMLVVIISPYFQKVPYTTYPRYSGRFWGQFWEAKSPREYSLHRRTLARNPGFKLTLENPGPPLVTDSMAQNLDPQSPVDIDITRAHYPRQLIIDPKFILDNLHLDKIQSAQAEKCLRNNEWMPIAEGTGYDLCLATSKYLAVSYRRDAYRHRPGDLDAKLAKELFENIRDACREIGERIVETIPAYWLDEHCMGKTWAEKNVDLFRIADVFRGAAATVIMIPGSEKFSEFDLIIPGIEKSESNYEALVKREWELWGTRIWTFPEALLSKRLFSKVGRGLPTSIALRQLSNLAFPDNKESIAIIDHYSRTDVLSRLELLSLLKEAIWQRGRSPGLPGATGSAPPAERVYALMGFFEHRVMPDNSETEEQALARLSMANDSDRFTERMISMLPSTIPQTACWYSDKDYWEANLWDIEPAVQVAGITESGSLVFNGCRAAGIRWKSFPTLTRKTKRGFKRDSATCVTILAPILLIFGGVFTKILRPFGITLIVFSVLIMVMAPRLIVYTISGRIKRPEPWLVGVEGAVTVVDAEYYLYAHKPSVTGEHKFKDSATGSQYAKPVKDGNIRLGETVYSEVSTLERSPRPANEKIFTLIDTVSSTIYYFHARCPPTVCVYMGREGGLGRYILCSERCDTGELHKESVLRMPTYLSDKMEQCDWIAIGHR